MDDASCTSRAAHAPRRPQVVPLLFFSYAPRLNEQTAVNRFVGNSDPHHHENESLATQKPVRVTRPGSVYSQRGYATCASSAFANFSSVSWARLVCPFSTHDMQARSSPVLPSMNPWRSCLSSSSCRSRSPISIKPLRGSCPFP